MSKYYNVVQLIIECIFCLLLNHQTVINARSHEAGNVLITHHAGVCAHVCVRVSVHVCRVCVCVLLFFFFCNPYATVYCGTPVDHWCVNF